MWIKSLVLEGRSAVPSRMQTSKKGMLAVCVFLCVLVCSTWDRGVVAILFAVAVLLSICILLCVLQTEFMTNLERLADCPHNTHGLTLVGERKRKKDIAVVIL